MRHRFKILVSGHGNAANIVKLASSLEQALLGHAGLLERDCSDDAGQGSVMGC